jgi:hypothetical protein
MGGLTMSDDYNLRLTHFLVNTRIGTVRVADRLENHRRCRLAMPALRQSRMQRRTLHAGLIKLPVYA